MIAEFTAHQPIKGHMSPMPIMHGIDENDEVYQYKQNTL